MDAKHGMMGEEEESLGSFSSLSGNSKVSSLSLSEVAEDTASSSPPTSSCMGPLFEMSCLKEQLPFKRGLSTYYQGKSRSFTSFANINCIGDLVKPERPLKKLKTSKTCGEGLDNRKPPPLKSCNKTTITKKLSSKGCFSTSITARRNCLLGSKPPLYPHRPSNLSDQTLWFA